MNNHNIRAAVAAVALAAVAAVPAVADAGSGKTETLRFFDKTDALILTRADGTVVTKPPFPEAVAGDVLDVYSSEYAGNHTRHAKKPSGSAHVRCVFAGAGEPDCEGHVALGGSLLIFRGSPGTVVGGAGRYLGATGRVVASKEVPGGSDIVAKIRRR
jgi:hypothetical protein